MRTKHEINSVEWFGGTPNGWSMVPLSALFRFSKGLSITKADLTESGKAVISYGQIHSKENIGVETNESLLRYVSSDLVGINSASKVLPDGFVFADTSEDLEGCGGNVRNGSTGELYGGYHTVVLNPKNDLDSKYLAYLFATDVWRYQIRRDLVDVKLFSVSQTSLNETYVVLPPEDTQKRIVSYLDGRCAAVDDDIAKRREAIEKLKEYKRAYISCVISEQSNRLRKTPHQSKSTLKHIASRIWDGPFGSHLKSADYIDRGVRVIRLENLRYMQFNDEKTSYVSQSKYESIKRHTVRPGDLIISTFISDEVKVAMLPDGIEFAVNKADCIGITPCKGIYNRYLQYALSTHDVFNQLKSMVHGSTRDRVNCNQIKAIKLPVPSEKAQVEIVKELDFCCAAIDEAIARQEQLIEKLGEYRKSIIHHAVTGKIDCMGA